MKLEGDSELDLVSSTGKEIERSLNGMEEVLDGSTIVDDLATIGTEDASSLVVVHSSSLSVLAS